MLLEGNRDLALAMRGSVRDELFKMSPSGAICSVGKSAVIASTTMGPRPSGSMSDRSSHKRLR
jgi:hypothetical protein